MTARKKAGDVTPPAAAVAGGETIPKGLPPPGTLMTACQVLTWLAFGKPVTKELFPSGPFDSPSLNDWGTSDLGTLLTLLEARASRHPFCPLGRKHLLSPEGPRFLRGLRAKVRREEGTLVTYAELASRLRARMDAQARLGWQLADATADLLGALRDGRITAFAATASGARAPVPVDTFMNFVVTVTVFDQVTADVGTASADYRGPHFDDLIFRSSDVAQSGLLPIPQRPKPDGAWLTAYEALCWIRFRDFPEQAVLGSAFDEARSELLAKFLDGRVTAQGRPDMEWPNTPNPDAGHVTLDPYALTPDAITLTEWGRIGPDLSRPWKNRGRDLPLCYSDVRFDRATVMQLWPARERPDTDSPADVAAAWMRRYADPGPSGVRKKRADAIKSCADALRDPHGVTSRVAEAAWNDLPDE